MRIVANQSIAGYPALKVRDFLWKHQLTGILKEAVQTSLNMNPTDAGDFLSKLVDQGLIKESHRQNGYPFFDLTDCGVRLAYASAAKPIHRKTAERILAEFMERVHPVNATPEYLYRVDGVVLFGSFLSDVEQLGDVNVAVNLESKARGEVEFQEWNAAPEGLNRLAFACLLVDKLLYRLRGDFRQLHRAELREVVGTDIGFVPMHRGSFFVDQLQRAVFLDETAKCHHLSRAGRAAVNGFKDDAQLLPRSFLREFLLRAKVDGTPFAHLLPLLGDDVISIETLPVGWNLCNYGYAPAPPTHNAEIVVNKFEFYP
jgi:hypothetical protein